MKRPLIAVDVDGTLIDEHDYPRYEVIDLVIKLSAYCNIHVWSGGGHEYARHWVDRLGLTRYVKSVGAKGPEPLPDMVIDDMPGLDEYSDSKIPVINVWPEYQRGGYPRE